MSSSASPRPHSKGRSACLGSWLGAISVIFIVGCMQGPAFADDAQDPLPVKVFILAGQSNMEGKAPDALFEHQATDQKTRDFFSHLRQDGEWVVRDDVFIKFLDRHGPLTLGYGSRGRTGAELQFGTRMGDALEEPVLLIKTAWGGHALFKQFRPPSAGLPNEEALREELSNEQQRVRSNNEKNNRDDPLPTRDEIVSAYGASYRMMMQEVRETMEQSDTLFPELAGRRLEIAGFVWFQGWNDQYGAEGDYAENLKCLIRDLRKDLNVSELPVVIAAMGQNGSKPAEGAMLTIQNAQLSMNEVAEFQGNVKAIRTDELVDKAAESLYPSWRENFETWQKTGGDFAYHYLGSAIWFTRIGDAMATAMLDLMSPEHDR